VATAKILDRKLLEQFELVAKLNPHHKDAIETILYRADKSVDDPSTLQALERLNDRIYELKNVAMYVKKRIYVADYY